MYCFFNKTVCFCALSVVLIGCNPQAQTPPADKTVSTSKTESFGEFRFEIPAGWSRVQPDKDKTVAMLLLNGTVWNNADGMCMVDVGKPAFPNAKEMAMKLAGN